MVKETRLIQNRGKYILSMTHSFKKSPIWKVRYS